MSGQDKLTKLKELIRALMPLDQWERQQEVLQKETDFFEVQLLVRASDLLALYKAIA
jgi:hypothetical protein